MGQSVSICMFSIKSLKMQKKKITNRFLWNRTFGARCERTCGLKRGTFLPNGFLASRLGFFVEDAHTISTSKPISSTDPVQFTHSIRTRFDAKSTSYRLFQENRLNSKVNINYVTEI